MLKKSLTLLSLGALLWLAAQTPEAAAFPGDCLDCSLDAYDQFICVVITGQGPEGGTVCLAYTNTCVLRNPCNYWV